MKPLTLLFAALLCPSMALAAANMWQPGPGRYSISGPCDKVSQELKALVANKIRLSESVPAAPELAPDAQQLCQAEVTPYLPNIVKALDDRTWLDGVGGFGNCHGEAAYLAGLSPMLMHDENAAITQIAIRSRELFPNGPKACDQIDRFADVRGGDIAVIYSTEKTPVHTFTMISKDLAFSKNGHNGTKIPYKVHSLSSVADEYFIEKKINLYREGLKRDIDCLRGDGSYPKCANAHLPYARYFRCKSLVQLEGQYRNALPAEYFQVKEQIWRQGQYYAADETHIFSPNLAANKNFWANYNRIEEIVKNLSQQQTPNPTLQYFWNQLASNTRAMVTFLDSRSRVRQILFKP